MLFAVKNYGGYLTGDKNRFFVFVFFTVDRECWRNFSNVSLMRRNGEKKLPFTLALVYLIKRTSICTLEI